MSTAPPLSIDPDTPQVLLFGHSRSGKSALLGALLKAAETQGPTLRGEVLESSGRLASIRDAVYRGAELEPATAELTSYTMRLRPWREGTKAVTDPVTVVVHDCSGTAAESLIKHPEKIQDPTTRAPVARAVIDTDAIVLMVDVTSSDEELLEAFEEFDTFLTIVSQAKANAREVGGFPVLLVLTHSDELAEPGDTLARWEARLERRADEAWAKFDKFLKDADPDDGVVSPFLPFGTVDLTVYTVAVRYPKLVGLPVQANMPYKVAELFRDCFAVAKSHRDRVTASNRRLKWTVRLALAFVAVLLLGVFTMVVFPPPQADPGLAERVIGYQMHEAEAAVRLAYPHLTRNKQALTGFREDPGFSVLPEDLRSFVFGRLKEIEDYEAFRSKLWAATAPGDTRGLDDLAKVEQALNGELGLPSQYAWGETHAAQIRGKWLADVAAIREAEQQYLDRYRDFVRRGIVLTLQPSLGNNWRSEVNSLVAEASRPPTALTEPLPDSPVIDHPRGQAVTNRVPYEFERVYNTRKDWEAARDRLVRLRDLADALGLTAGPDRPKPVLVLPEPGPGVDSTTLPTAAWADLFRTYPRESEDFREWEIRNFPDPVRSLLADRLDRNFRVGARHVHGLIRARLGPDVEQKDTSAWWRSFADSLGDPATPFPEWGRLLHLLVRLRDPAATNPVGDLAGFLRRDKFELDIRGFDLLVPPDLSLDRVTPAGPIVVTVTSRNGVAVTKSFKQVGAGVREGSATSYRFTAESNAKLTYYPGDDLKAELPLKAGTQELNLLWESGASRTYQFDKLTREPRLLKPGGGSEPASGVRLTPTPGSALPQLPALFPDLRR